MLAHGGEPSFGKESSSDSAKVPDILQSMMTSGSYDCYWWGREGLSSSASLTMASPSRPACFCGEEKWGNIIRFRGRVDWIGCLPSAEWSLAPRALLHHGCAGGRAEAAVRGGPPRQTPTAASAQRRALAARCDLDASIVFPPRLPLERVAACDVGGHVDTPSSAGFPSWGE